MSSPVRVLHVIDGLGGGGAERLLFEIIRLSDPARVRHRITTVQPHHPNFALAERLHALGAYDPPPNQAASPSPVATLLPTRTSPLRSLLRWMPVDWKKPIWDAEPIVKSLPRALKELRASPPDIIHGHNLAGFRASLALHLLSQKRWMETVSCNFAQLEFYGWKSLIADYRRFRRLVSRWFIAEPYVGELCSLGISPERIGPMRGVIDLAAANQAHANAVAFRRDIRRELGVAEDALLLLSVGRTNPTKGHEHAIDALASLVKQFPNLHWMLLGPVHGSPGYEERARALGVSAHVHVLGYRDEPLPYYAAADVYLRTALLEADTLASYNAMALGLPVVGFDSGGATELVPTVGHGILVPRADSIALGAAVGEILSRPDRGRAQGQKGIAYAARHLDIRATVEEVVGSYER